MDFIDWVITGSSKMQVISGVCDDIVSTGHNTENNTWKTKGNLVLSRTYSVGCFAILIYLAAYV